LQTVNRLDVMHRKHLLPGFDDRSSDEAAIEDLTDAITKVGYSLSAKLYVQQSLGPFALTLFIL